MINKTLKVSAVSGAHMQDCCQLLSMADLEGGEPLDDGLTPLTVLLKCDNSILYYGDPIVTLANTKCDRSAVKHGTQNIQND